MKKLIFLVCLVFVPIYSIFKYVSLPSISDVVFEEIKGELICSSKNNHYQFLLKGIEQTYIVRVKESCDDKTLPLRGKYNAGIVGDKVWILSVNKIEIVNYETSLELAKKDILYFLFFWFSCGVIFYCIIAIKGKFASKGKIKNI
jgi:hypothetical protein